MKIDDPTAAATAVRLTPAGVDLSAFRILQEALINALEHAGPARARVVLRYREDDLEIAISDGGPDTGDKFWLGLRPSRNARARPRLVGERASGQPRCARRDGQVSWIEDRLGAGRWQIAEVTSRG